MSNRPVTLSVAAAMLAAEAAVPLGLTVYIGYEILIGAGQDVMSGIALAAFCLLLGAAIGLIAWGLLRVRRWSRGPAVVTQIFVLPISVSMIQAHDYDWGVPLLAAAVIALVTVLAPRSTKALMD